MGKSILFYGAKVYDAERLDFIPADLIVENGMITSVLPRDLQISQADADIKINVSGKLLAPGLVDVHTHGRAGKDFTSADKEGMFLLAKSYLFSGVTSVMPTLASAEFDSLLNSCALIDEISKEDYTGARFIGTHLEGRYLNPKKRGAHAPEMLKAPDADEIKLLMSKMGNVKHISAAYELDEDGSFAAAALEGGATLGLAHTNATYGQAVLAAERGVTSFTHLFNCMPPLHHRDGGAVCKALTDKKVFAELIVDGVHINPEMVRLAYMMKGSEKLVLITDSMEATGCPDGEYFIAGEPVTVTNGKALTHDGALAGSTLSLIDGVRNLSKFCGISFGEALVCATRNPAKMIGVSKVGELIEGYFADMLILNKNYELESVVLGGNICK